MASPVAYQPFCPAGAALNVIGERWALLIVRDLMLGPRRYSELLAGLSGIATDILAARLRSLQAHGIVRRVGTGRDRRYALTDNGQALRPVLVELARWGSDRLELPADLSAMPPRVPLTALLISATGLPGRATGYYQLRVRDEAVFVQVRRGQVHAAPDAPASTSITLTMTGLRALILGDSASDIEHRGDVTIEGHHHQARAFLDGISRPQVLDGLRLQLSKQLSAADCD